MNKKLLAQFISVILGPQIWLPVLLAVFLLKTNLSQEQMHIQFFSLLSFQILVPFIALCWLVKTKRVSDWEISIREERHLILSIFMISTCVVLFIAYYAGTRLFFNLYLILWICALIGMIITYIWKISVHLLLNTAAVIIVNFLFDWKLPMLYLLIPIVAWARHYLKQHTFGQIIGGIIASATTLFAGLTYFGYR